VQDVEKAVIADTFVIIAVLFIVNVAYLPDTAAPAAAVEK